MKVTPLEIDGLLLIHLDVHEDSRGFFVERFHFSKLSEHGLPIQIRQINHSYSQAGVLRGLHYQQNPPQGKLVGVTRGRVLDVAVDIRKGSPHLGKSVQVELSQKNGQLLWIPAGFAHGFCVLGDEPADLLYFVDAEYNPQGEGGIRWNDPELKIQWPLSHPSLSPKDESLPLFSEYCKNPQF